MRKLRHAHGVALALSNLGIVAVREGDGERAVILHEESLALWREARRPGRSGQRARQPGSGRSAPGRPRPGQCALRGGSAAVRGTREQAENGDHDRVSRQPRVRDRGDDRQAAALFGTALALSRDVDDKLNVADCLEGLAGPVTRLGQAASAARLLGSTAALREAIGAPVAAHFRATYDQIVAATRAKIGEAAFEAAWAAGRALPLERAIAEALSLIDELA